MKLEIDIKKIGIVLAEDHVLVREGISDLLQQERGMEVVGEAEDGEEAGCGVEEGGTVG